MPTLTINEVIEDHGTIVVFGTEEGPEVLGDHGCARAIGQALEDDGYAEVDAADWQIRGEYNKPEPTLTYSFGVVAAYNGEAIASGRDIGAYWTAEGGWQDSKPEVTR